MNRKYVIIDYPPTKEQLDACLESCPFKVRVNQDKSKCVVKYYGVRPFVLEEVLEYSAAEIKIELAKSEWNMEDV